MHEEESQEFAGFERRRYERLEVEFEAKITEPDSGETSDAKVLFQAKTKNISLGGVLLELSKDLPIGTRWDVEVSIAGWQQYLADFLEEGSDCYMFRAKAEVARSHEVGGGKAFQVGMRFLEIEDEPREALRSFLQNHFDN